MTDETTTTKKAGLSPLEVGAGAGAAVIAAFATSYLGTAGTLTGAAVASVVGTVGTSLLRSSAQTSAHRLKQTTTRLRDTRVQHTEVTDVRPVESEDVDPYGTQLFGASDWIDPETRGRLAGPTAADPGSSWEPPTQRLSGPDGTTAGRPYLPGGTAGAERSGESGGRIGQGLRRVRGRWVVTGAGALAAFALALGAITGIEAAAGKPLSGLAGRESGGGTTLGRATGADSGSDRSTPSPTPTPTTSGGATSTAPSPGNGPTVSPTAPSSPPASPAPSPTQQPPTQAPTQAPSAPNQTP
jgi:hypothetical protein